MTLNQLKFYIDMLIEKGYGKSRVILNIGNCIQSTLEDVGISRRPVQENEEFFVMISDSDIVDVEIEEDDEDEDYE